MQQIIFIADLIAYSTCFGFKLSVWCGAEGYVSGLRAAVAQQPNLCLGEGGGIVEVSRSYTIGQTQTRTPLEE